MPKRHHLLLLGLLFIINQSKATTFDFNPNLIDGAGKNVDLSLFDHDQEQPGTYYVSVFLNGSQVDASNLNFSLQTQKNGIKQLTPCLTAQRIAGYGVNLKPFISSMTAKSAQCFNISTIPGAMINFNFNQQSVFINIPQIFLDNKFSGLTPKKLWNDGINAFFVNYDINTGYNQYTFAQHSSLHNNSAVVLSPGLNLGAWRVRGQFDWQKTSGSAASWSNANIYATRGLYDIDSRITVGKSYTAGDLFGSFPFIGVMLASDTNMVPTSKFSYAPVVRGVAKTQARVEIAENGTILYNQIVAPGPFSISNFSPLGANGVLNVTILEKNGESHTFNVAYSTPIIALKQHYLEYNFVLGNEQFTNTPAKNNSISQGYFIYGLPHNITAYAGFQLSNNFDAYSAGLGFSMGKLGGLSLDTTTSNAKQSDGTTQLGQQIRLRYNTKITLFGTDLSLIDDYNSPKYTTLSNYFQHAATVNPLLSEQGARHPKNSLQLNITQPLSSQSSFYLNSELDNYWNSHNYHFSLSSGFSIELPVLNHATLSLEFSSSESLKDNPIPNTPFDSDNNNMLSTWLSIPLNRYLGFQARLLYRYLSPLQGKQHSNVIDLSGNAAEQSIHWDIGQQQQQNGSQSLNSGYLNASWSTAYGQFGSNYNYSKGYSALGVSASGGVLLYNDDGKVGLVPSQQIEGSAALVEAPGASGASINGLAGVVTDYAGNTVKSFLQPYQKNSISLDPVNLPTDVSIANDNINVIPTEGAIVAARFKTDLGAHAIITLLEKNGQPFPFGSLVTNQQNNTQSVIGLNGEAYLTGLGKSGTLLAKSSQYQCVIHYTLPSKPSDNMDGIYEFNEQCQ